MQMWFILQTAVKYMVVCCAKRKNHEICPKFGPHILVSNVGAVETERRKKHMTLNNTTFFVFGNCGLLNFPWEWYIQHISTWNSKANQFFFSMVVSVG